MFFTRKERSTREIETRGILMRDITRANRAILSESLRWLLYQELQERMGRLGSDRVYQLAKDRLYRVGIEQDIRNYINNKGVRLVQKKPI